MGNVDNSVRKNYFSSVFLIVILFLCYAFFIFMACVFLRIIFRVMERKKEIKRNFHKMVTQKYIRDIQR